MRFGDHERRRTWRTTDLYCPLNPFLVNTLPALMILLHVLSGHQLYSDINTGDSEFMGGSDGIECQLAWVHFGVRGVGRARVLAAYAASISSLTSTRWRSDQYVTRARSRITHSMQSCAECAFRRVNQTPSKVRIYHMNPPRIVGPSRKTRRYQIPASGVAGLYLAPEHTLDVHLRRVHPPHRARHPHRRPGTTDHMLSSRYEYF